MYDNLDKFLEAMTPELAGCPLPLVKAKLINAARVFAERTDSLRETIAVPGRPGQYRYALEAGFPSDVLKIDWVKIGEFKLGDDDWEFAPEEDDEPTLVVSSAYGCMLADRPTLSVRAIMAPKTDCTCAPGKWLDRWHEGIVGYAMQDLLGMDGAVWANGARAAIHSGRYQAAVARARMNARALRGHEKARGITA